MSWAEHVARMEERGSVYRGLLGKPEGKRPLGKPRLTLEDYIKMDLQEVGWEMWTGPTWLRIRTGDGPFEKR